MLPTTFNNYEATEIPEVVKENYDFEGWFINDIQFNFTTPIVEDIGLTARWTKKQISLKFYKTSAMNELVDTISGFFDDAVSTTPINPTLRGHNFVGWSPSIPAKFPAENTNFIAQFAPQTYNINYELNGGTLGHDSPTTHTYNTKTTLVNPTREGREFVGWFTNEQCTGIPLLELAATNFTADITLFAAWKLNGSEVGIVNISAVPKYPKYLRNSLWI